VGRRRFADIGGVGLELGGRLDRVRVAYESWGVPDRTASNAVLVLHALTGDSHVVGDAGPGHPTPGWWDGPMPIARGFPPMSRISTHGISTRSAP